MLLCFAVAIHAQSNAQQPPLISLFSYLKVETTVVKKAAPHFPFSYSSEMDFQQKLNYWLEKYPNEWKAFSSLSVFTKAGIAWSTYGVAEKYIEQPVRVNSSWYEWYKASGITPEQKQKLFPHFPHLDNTLSGDTLGLNFERRVGMWQRLYPKEYITFLNTPQIKSLNPYVSGKIDIQYMPRFIGAGVTDAAPVKESTGDELNDEFNYQLKLRNWLFVYFPDKFQTTYGNDYDFPTDFSANDYRNNWKARVEKTKQADWGTNSLGK